MRVRLFALTVRLAARNALRRKGETVLVVLGSLLGTAIITSSLVVGDTLHATIRDEARTRLGPIDEVVLVHHLADVTTALQRITARPLPQTDGSLVEITASVAVATVPDVSGRRFAAPDAFAQEVEFDLASGFGGDPSVTGFGDAGATPSGDEAVLGADLADELHLHAGDRFELFAYGKRLSLRVRGTVPRLGVAGFHPGFETSARNVFLAPGTLASLAVGAPATAVAPEARILVSNDGGVFDSTGPTAAVVRELQIRGAGITGLEFVDEKAATLAFADRQGTNFARLFGLIGSFSVAAGVLLLVNVFVMLAEERKAELGMLRAVGFERWQLVRLFGLEGAGYSVAAAAFGAGAGVGVGAVVARLSESVFAQGRRGITSLQFAVRPASVVAGLGAGLAIALVTVWATSMRISRLNIIRAIRDAPEPPHRSRRGARLALDAAGALAGAGVFAVGVVHRQPLAALAGPALLALCLAPLLTRVFPRRLAVSLPAAALLAYGIGAFELLPRVFEGSEIGVFFVHGVVLVLAGVVFAVTNGDAFRVISRWPAALGGGLSLRLGLATPLARRVRTGLLLGMYALVVFVLVFIAVFAAVFRAQAPRIADDTRAGFDLEVDSSAGNPVTVDVLARQDGVAVAVSLLRAEAQFQTSPTENAVTQRLTGFDSSLLARGGPRLTARDPRYASDADAWRAVLASPQLAIVPADFLSTGGGGGPPRTSVHVGDRLTLIDPSIGRRHAITIAGIDGAVDPAQNGAMVAASTLPSIVDRTSASRFYVAVEPGAAPDVVAARLQDVLLDNGVKADTFRSLVDDRLRAQSQFIALLEGFLGLGLLIGIAGLGVVMVRAVRERRREIGMLRAMGFRSSVVRRAFLVEASFIAVQGIVIGGALGILTAYSVLSRSSTFGGEALTFTVPWAALALLGFAALLASLLAVAAPATQASRIRPAVALRITD